MPNITTNQTIVTSEPLLPFPFRVTERLCQWAKSVPNKTFLAQRGENGQWQHLTYDTAYKKALAAASFLLKHNPAAKPVALIAPNSLQHAIISLGAMHVGMPYCPISPMYFQKSDSSEKLKNLLKLLEPGLIFCDESNEILKGFAPVITIPSFNKPCDVFETTDSDRVNRAYDSVERRTIAKILFTSGSTGQPKGVINTHENITSNWQQLTQTFPFVQHQLTVVDWLPWNHTYGGNHNLGLVLFNGGTLYIDGGNPTAHGIEQTVANLKEISPTVHFNVPRGFDALLPFLETDNELRESFFKNLAMMFYAGASLSRSTWNKLEQLSIRTLGRKVLIGAGLGSTETSPTALLQAKENGFAGLLGLPVPGLELKLVAQSEKWEARYKGKNVFPGYWNQPELTREAFDEDGFYKSGDALKFADATHPEKGLVFDGRLNDDFKLDSGTWVHSTVLRAQFLNACDGLREVIICGQDKPYVCAVLFAAEGWTESAIAHVTNALHQLGRKSKGSSTLIKKAFLASFEPNPAAGELTEKGTVNGRQLLRNHPEIMFDLYDNSNSAHVISLPD